MAMFQSIHFGVNHVDPEHYQNLRPLRAAVNDARNWADLAKNILGYQKQEIFTDEQATSRALFDRLGQLAVRLQAGDALLLTFAGHGGQLEDLFSPKTGDEDMDETWCLYDRQVVDDELHLAFSKFREGVRISVIADCCHSGTALKVAAATVTATEVASINLRHNQENAMERAGYLPRRLSQRDAANIFSKNNALYSGILQKIRSEKSDVRASVQLFAACQDDQVTYDGPSNGIFTEAFKTLFYSGDWQQLTNRMALLEHLRRFFRYPTPNHQAYGPGLNIFDQKFPLLADLAAVANPAPAPAIERQEPNPPVAVPTLAPDAKPAFYKVKIESPAGRVTIETIRPLCPAPLTDIRQSDDGSTVFVWFPAGMFPSVWEPVHHIAKQADAAGLNIYIEPVNGPGIAIVEPAQTGARDTADGFTYLPYWPPNIGTPEPLPGWHLDDTHSQLKAAREFVWEKMRNNELAENVRIGHLDTGWYPWHPGFAGNPNILRNLTRSFVDSEKGTNLAAVDLQYKNREQQGHGSGTLGVLSCWQLDAQHTGNVQLDHLGAVPFTEVIPIRIADNVLIFDSENFCEGLEHAIANGCEVVTLSMGGKPSRKMAKLINKAYEKGITLVCAAGNNITRGIAQVGPRTVVWPARFERVLAACGACHNHVPYDFEAQEKYGAGGVRTNNLRYMQGNWGPATAMRKALAAYSPNIAWVVDDESPYLLRKTGGGTSAATPQIAAAAALWITLHKTELKRRGYHGTWKQVEAVREALFRTADKGFPEAEKYYGNGILRAMDALQYGIPDITDDMLAGEAKSSLFGLGETLRLFLHRRRAEMPGPVLQQTLALELQHLLMEDAEQAGQAGDLPQPNPDVLPALVQRAGYCSEWLRECISN
ncbi:MAG: S8 family serine peptidase [Saprospiraceae bacterium]